MTTILYIAVILLFFVILLLFITRISRAIAEQRINNISKLSVMTDYIKFASNFDKAEKAAAANEIVDAVEYYRAALHNLESVDKKDHLVFENIQIIEDKLKNLDKTAK